MRTPGAYPLRVLRGLVPGRNKLSSHISTLSLFLSPSLPPSSLLLNHPVHTTTTTQRHSNGHSNFSPARVFSPSRTFSRLLSLSLLLSLHPPRLMALRSLLVRGFTHLPRPAAPFPFARRGRRTKGTKESDALSVYPHTPPSYASSFSFPPPPPSSRRLSLFLVLFHASRYSRFCRSRRRDYAYWRRRPALLPVNEMFCIRRR